MKILDMPFTGEFQFVVIKTTVPPGLPSTMNVILKYFTNKGTEVRKTCTTVEAAILAGRRARQEGGAHFRAYSIDDGKTWIRI